MEEISVLETQWASKSSSLIKEWAYLHANEPACSSSSLMFHWHAEMSSMENMCKA